MRCKVKDIAIVTMGQSPKSEYYNSVGKGMPFLQGNRTFGRLYPTFDTYTTVPTKIAEAGDVIMSVRAPVGELNITPVKMCLGRGVCSLHMKNGNQQFLYYLMKCIVPQLIKKENGTVFGSVNRNDISEQAIDIPSDENQQKHIARYFSAIDEKIEINYKINDNLQQQALTIYEKMFLNHSDIASTSGVLSDIATITMGQSPSGSSYNESGDGEVFYQGRAEFGTRFPTRRLYTTEPKRMAEASDVLLSVRAPVGDLNVAYERCCIGRGLGAIHSKDGNSSYLLYTMFSLKPQLEVFNGEGTVFGSINRDALNTLSIEIPPIDKIAQFEAIVHPIDELIRINYEETYHLQSLRDLLLPKLMCGEIDVRGLGN